MRLEVGPLVSFCTLLHENCQRKIQLLKLSGENPLSTLVGYQNTTFKYETGYNFIIPTFQDVGAQTATYNLQNIKLVDATGDLSMECLVGYSEYATLSGTDYFWGVVGGCWWADLEKDGWYIVGEDEEENPTATYVENVTLPLGTGLYLNCATEGASVQYAGQVFDGPVTYELPWVGYSIIGNPSPVTIDLQQISLVDATGDLSMECLVGYTEYATLSGTDYFWGIEGGVWWADIEKDGWYIVGEDEEENPTATYAEDVKLLPGQGLYLNCATEGAKVKINAGIKLN